MNSGAKSQKGDANPLKTVSNPKRTLRHGGSKLDVLSGRSTPRTSISVEASDREVLGRSMISSQTTTKNGSILNTSLAKAPDSSRRGRSPSKRVSKPPERYLVETIDVTEGTTRPGIDHRPLHRSKENTGLTSYSDDACEKEARKQRRNERSDAGGIAKKRVEIGETTILAGSDDVPMAKLLYDGDRQSRLPSALSSSVRPSGEIQSVNSKKEAPEKKAPRPKTSAGIMTRLDSLDLDDLHWYPTDNEGSPPLSSEIRRKILPAEEAGTTGRTDKGTRRTQRESSSGSERPRNPVPGATRCSQDSSSSVAVIEEVVADRRYPLRKQPLVEPAGDNQQFQNGTSKPRRPVTRSMARKNTPDAEKQRDSGIDDRRSTESFPSGPNGNLTDDDSSTSAYRPFLSPAASTDGTGSSLATTEGSDIENRSGTNESRQLRPRAGVPRFRSFTAHGVRRNPERKARENQLVGGYVFNESLPHSPPKKRPRMTSQNPSGSGSPTFEPGVFFPTEETSFKTIGGYSAVKAELTETILEPFRRQLQALSLKQPFSASQSPKGALFWGPPGTGKTLMAKALAYECGVGFDRSVPVFTIGGAELLTKWVGESEGQLRRIFQQAQEYSPSIVLIDELDGLARRRTSSDHDNVNFNMVSTLLTLLNGVNERGPVLVIATTNFKDAVDLALLRSGRFDNKIHFPPPNESERLQILQALTAKWKHPVVEENLKVIARCTPHFTGADLDLLCRRAEMNAIIRMRKSDSWDQSTFIFDPEVQACDFFPALRKIQPVPVAASSSGVRALYSDTVKLIKRQADGIIQQIEEYTPLHSSNESLTTAAFAKFCCPSMLLNYDRVVYIHSKDSILLAALAEYITNKLAEDNRVTTFDCGQLSAMKILPTEFGKAFQERSLVLTLLNLDAFYSTSEYGEPQMIPAVTALFNERQRLDGPIFIITSTHSPVEIKSSFRNTFGELALTIEAKKPSEQDCRSYFEDMFLVDARKVIGKSGTIHVLKDEESGNRTSPEQLLQRVSKCLAGSPLFAILKHHAALSKALWRDRMQVEKKHLKEAVTKLPKEPASDQSLKRRLPSDNRILDSSLNVTFDGA